MSTRSGRFALFGHADARVLSQMRIGDWRSIRPWSVPGPGLVPSRLWSILAPSSLTDTLVGYGGHVLGLTPVLVDLLPLFKGFVANPEASGHSNDAGTSPSDWSYAVGVVLASYPLPDTAKVPKHEGLPCSRAS